MADSITPPDDSELPESPRHDAAPLAMLAFLQRLVATMSSGGDVNALMADAPPGFRELFDDAERRVQAGETPDLASLMTFFGSGEDAVGDDSEEEGDEGG